MKISVITVVFNAVADIEATIISVLSQKYPDLEYIIIDGGSKDGTIDIINQYKSQLAYFISEPDGGIYQAMNKGLAVSSGDWVHFKNAGDRFLPEAINSFVRAAIQYPNAKIIYGDTLKVWQTEPLVTSEIIGDHTQLKTRCTVDHRTNFFRGDWHRANPYNTNFKWVADYFLILQLFINEPNSFIHLNKPMALMQQGGASDSLKVYDELYLAQKEILGEAYAKANQQKLLKAAKRKQLKDSVLKLILGTKGFQKFKARKKR